MKQDYAFGLWFYCILSVIHFSWAAAEAALC